MAIMRILKTVYFVRHGQSEGNISPEFQSPHSPLSPAGQAQAESVASRIAKIEFETLIASPFQRARETALAIAKETGKRPEFSDLFAERALPTSIHGRPHSDSVANTIWKRWEESMSTLGLHAEDGENFDDLVVRSVEALAFLEARPEETLVVVTHGYFLRTLLARVLLGAQWSGPLSLHTFLVS